MTLANAITLLAIAAPVCLGIAKMKLRNRDDVLTWREFKLFREGMDARFESIENDLKRICRAMKIDPWGS